MMKRILAIILAMTLIMGNGVVIGFIGTPVDVVKYQRKDLPLTRNC